jgi:23S rRNA (guanine745-N1)-methyltransferase
MPVAELLDLLRCPVCTAAFTDDGGGVRCASGHRFDLARQGYLNLLQSPPPRHADTPEMVAARERFLGGGPYRPVADALVVAVRSGLVAVRGAAAPAAPALLETGAGTGYYTAALLDGLGGRGLALDISTAAARRAARAHHRVAAVVADAWGPLPVADARLDVVASVFAPRNAAEFARVLRPDGVLAVVTPLPEHLQELRRALGLLDVEEDKQERLASTLAGAFSPLTEEQVRYPVSWAGPVVVDLVAMGPNAFHLSSTELTDRVSALPDPVSATVAVSISTWVRAPAPATPR